MVHSEMAVLQPGQYAHDVELCFFGQVFVASTGAVGGFAAMVGYRAAVDSATAVAATATATATATAGNPNARDVSVESNPLARAAGGGRARPGRAAVVAGAIAGGSTIGLEPSGTVHTHII